MRSVTQCQCEDGTVSASAVRSREGKRCSEVTSQEGIGALSVRTNWPLLKPRLLSVSSSSDRSKNVSGDFDVSCKHFCQMLDYDPSPACSASISAEQGSRLVWKQVLMHLVTSLYAS